VTIVIEAIGPNNADLFKDIRVRALQDPPTACSSTYAEESKLTDADWLKRAAQWSGATSVAYLAMATAAQWVSHQECAIAMIASAPI